MIQSSVQVVILTSSFEVAEDLQLLLGGIPAPVTLQLLLPNEAGEARLRALLEYHQRAVMICCERGDEAAARLAREFRLSHLLPALVEYDRTPPEEAPPEDAGPWDLRLSSPLEQDDRDRMQTLLQGVMAQAAPLEVLVIEDDPLDWDQIRRALRGITGVRMSVKRVDSGAEGIRECLTHRFDVVLLDVRLPDISGIDVLREVRLRSDVPPQVIALTGIGSGNVIRDLFHLGVSEYVSKQELSSAFLRWAIGRVMGSARSVSFSGKSAPLPHRVLVIIGSAGSDQAAAKLLAALTRTSDRAVVVAQHHSRFRFGSTWSLGNLSLQWVRDGEAMVAGHVYVNQPGHDVAIRGGRFVSLDTRSYGKPVPSLDILLRSLADEAGERLAVVVLSGMAEDGVRGVAAVKECGGTVLVEDPESAPVPELPRAVDALGVADEVLRSDELVERMRAL